MDFEIEEGLPGQFGGSLGFSETYGVTLGGNFIHSNFMGTGRRVALELRGGEYQKIYDINFTDPYRNIDGVARTMSFTYQDITQFTSVTSDFSTTTLSAGMNWSYPIANFQRMTFGFAYQDAELLTSDFRFAPSARVGAARTASRSRSPTPSTAPKSRASISSPAGRTTRAMRHCFRPGAARLSMGLNMTVPGSDVEYYTATVDFTKYVPLFGGVAVQSQ